MPIKKNGIYSIYDIYNWFLGKFTFSKSVTYINFCYKKPKNNYINIIKIDESQKYFFFLSNENGIFRKSVSLLNPNKYEKIDIFFLD